MYSFIAKVLLKIRLINEKTYQEYLNTIQYLQNPICRIRKGSYENYKTQTKGHVIITFPLALIYLVILCVKWVFDIDILSDYASQIINLYQNWKILFYAIFLGPIIEEMIFRLPLSLNKRDIFISIIACVLFIPIHYGIFETYNFSLYIALISIALFFLTTCITPALLKYLRRDTIYPSYFWTMNLLFAGLHLLSYQWQSNILFILFSTILFITYIHISLMFSLVRIDAGLKYAIWTHMGVNFFALLINW